MVSPLVDVFGITFYNVAINSTADSKVAWKLGCTVFLDMSGLLGDVRLK